MDLIKETYNILVHHLGEDTPRGRRFPEAQAELKSDITNLISYAIAVGKRQGRQEIIAELTANRKAFEARLESQERDNLNQLRARRPESREFNREEDD